MTQEMLVKRLHEMAVETGGLNCLGCGFEHSCGIHGCAVLKAAAEMIEHTPPVGRCGTCSRQKIRGREHFCYVHGILRDMDDFCSYYEPKEADK